MARGKTDPDYRLETRSIVALLPKLTRCLARRRFADLAQEFGILAEALSGHLKVPLPGIAVGESP